MRIRALLPALLAAPLSAATFIVPDDSELTRRSEAIVRATILGNQAEASEAGIVTVTTARVDEVLRGDLQAGASMEVVQPGGVVGEVGLYIPGTARFAAGEQVLLFLIRDGAGRWRPRDLTLGRFRLLEEGGRLLSVRDLSESTVWDRRGLPHREPLRLAVPFLEYVREVAAGGDPAADYILPPRSGIAMQEIVSQAAPIGTYLIQQDGDAGRLGIRWRTFPAPLVFLSNGTQPGAAGGGITAVQRGMASWTNDPNSNIVLQYGGNTTRNSGFRNADGVNSIQFNDPSDEIAGSFTGSGTLAIGGAWFSVTGSSSSHAFVGERFYTIQEADLVVQNGLGPPGVAGNGFDHVITHELGHTLGLRHSDEPPTGGTSTSAALMNSSVDFHNDRLGATLQPWDIEAVSAVYGAGATPCAPPVITTQPQNADSTGATVTLVVTASGTGPLQYQWYTGTRGDTRSPIPGATQPSIDVRPATTTNYWVRVSGACTPAADSNTVTVTANGCPAVSITGISADSSIFAGRTTALTVSVLATNRPLTIRWFAGEVGDTSRPAGSGSSISVTPTATTRYWVEVANDCGASASAGVVTVTVMPCTEPRVVVQPSNSEVVIGDPVSLSATIAGTTPIEVQWYEGTTGDISRPLPNATSASVITPPLQIPSSFWMRAINPCGTVDTRSAAVTVVGSCTAPRITAQPRQVTVEGSPLLTVTATGPSLTYRWYQGAVFDFSRPVGSGGPLLALPPINGPTQFWVRISNSCGTVDSVSVTVTPPAGRRRAVGP